ncbi:response regulator [Candidatus Leptofilum sp.]|uniref:response regulator n=1 Tax=Candidatus Leptofilum sp. TaxID=3241576 RepID=UPI003B5B1139
MKKNSKVLLVEDDGDWLELYQVYLEDEPYNLYAARTLHQAIEMLTNNIFDVVVTDLKMLGFGDDYGGFNILQKTKELNPGTQVIVITAYGSRENAFRAMQQGAFDYVEKPPIPDKFIISISRAIQATEKLVTIKNLTNDREIKHTKKDVSTKNLQSGQESIIGNTLRMQNVFEQMAKAVRSNFPVLIWGEQGTGKRLLAKAIHSNNPKNSRFLVIPCTKLFDFRDVIKNNIIKYKSKNQTGTFFLHNINFLDDSGQKILIELLPLFKNSGLRVIASFTSEEDNLAIALEKRNIRHPIVLYFANLTINVPPLRYRKEDIPALAGHFLNILSQDHNFTSQIQLAPEVINYLTIYDYRNNNVQELREILQNTILLIGEEKVIFPEHLPSSLSKQNDDMKNPNPETTQFELRKILDLYFNESEQRDICLELNIDYESLEGVGKGNKAREIVAYCTRRNRLKELAIVLKNARPHISVDFN